MSKYYILWIEGLTCRTGEKIKELSEDDHSYTTYLTEALRIKKGDLPAAKQILRERGVSEDTLKTCAVGVSYAPKNRVWKNPRLEEKK